MPDLIRRALSATQESKYVEFKSGFDPKSPGDWCELIKDIVAIANTGGGIIVFGLSSNGIPTGDAVEAIEKVDPADITNKIAKYTGLVDFELDIVSLEKDGNKLVGFRIHSVSVPLIFQHPGTYDIGSGKQRTAFSKGTIYFRHGAKSQPGTSEDIRKVIDRRLEDIRKSWLKSVRKVVQAPPGSQVVTVSPIGRGKARIALAANVRAVKDPNATPVRLTRDPNLASGSFVHEEISDGIFDEINNVIDANRALARGPMQNHFLLGQPIYYRIYAERHHVVQTDDTRFLLLHSALMDLYAPYMFWIISLPDSLAAKALGSLYVDPRNPNIHALLRIAMLLGHDFCEWLFGKWHAKWQRHPQPPTFYWTFKGMIDKTDKLDPRTLAARLQGIAQVQLNDGECVSITGLLENPKEASSALTKACMAVFEGNGNSRSLARSLDYLTYGIEIQQRARDLIDAILETIGNRSPGDPLGNDDPNQQ